MRSRPSRDAIKFTVNVESLMKTADVKGSSMFGHMNTRNLSKAEMDEQKRKKRKLNEISKTEIVHNKPVDMLKSTTVV